MFEVDHAKYEEGRAAYARGASVLGLAEAVERGYQAQMATPYEDGRYNGVHERAAKSLVLGFVQGLVEDIRKIAGSSRGGVKA